MTLKLAKDKIPGGLADKKSPSDFSPKALSRGIKAELEHTSDKNIAREIAMDHLTEDPKYYEKLELIETHNVKKSKPAQKSHRELLPLIDEVRERIKKTDVVKDMCREHGVETDYIDLIPMAFADLDVSARTDKGCIYFNYRLLDDDDFLNDDHYMAHEIVHHFQQCHGDGPTTGGDGEDYLDNEYEIEGFQAQTEYLAETRDNNAAEKYVDQVLDHHDVNGKDRKKRKDELLNIALQGNNLIKDAGLFTPPEALVTMISDYVRKAYSSSVLLKAKEELELGKDNNEVWDSLESEDEEGNVTGAFQDIGYLFFDAINTLEPGQDTTFNIGHHPKTRLLRTKYAIKGYLGLDDSGEKYTLYVDGGFDNDGNPIKVTIQDDKDAMTKHLHKVHKSLDSYIEELVKIRTKLADFLLEGDIEIEYESLMQKCRDEGGSHKAWAEIWPIPLEDILDTLRGSPYLKEFDRLKMLRKLEPTWPPVITVELEYKNKIESSKGDAAGQWLYGPMALMVAVGDLREYTVGRFEDANIFDVRLFSILKTVHHEIIHMLQFILTDLKSTKDKEVWHGLPSKKLRDPAATDPMGRLRPDIVEQYKRQKEYPGDPRDQYAMKRWEFEKKMVDKTRGTGGIVPHSLMDVEFYTYLSDGVKYFNKASEGESPNLRLEHAKLWVGAPNKFAELAQKEGIINYMFASPDPFFMWLKNQAPKKWQKAVKEFFKATNALV